MKKSTLLAAVLLTSTFGFGFASDAGADVINFGRDGAVCFLSGTFAGEGKLTLVSRSGNLETFSCQGEINDPAAAPDRAFRTDVTCNATLSGQLVVTPSGRFSGVCSGNR